MKQLSPVRHCEERSDEAIQGRVGKPEEMAQICS